MELHLDDLLVDIIADGFDLAFRIGEPKDSSLIARKIARKRFLLLASPEFIETYGMPTSIEELASYPAASYTSQSLRVESIHYCNDKNEECEQKTQSTFRANDGEVLLLKPYLAQPMFLYLRFLLKMR